MIHKLVTFVGLVLAASSVACSANVEPPSASQSAGISEAETQASAVIWIQAEQKVTQYIGPAGQVISHRVGFEMAVGSAILRLKTSRSDALLACSVDFGNGEYEMNGRYASSSYAPAPIFSAALIGGARSTISRSAG